MLGEWKNYLPAGDLAVAVAALSALLGFYGYVTWELSRRDARLQEAAGAVQEADALGAKFELKRVEGKYVFAVVDPATGREWKAALTE